MEHLSKDHERSLSAGAPQGTKNFLCNGILQPCTKGKLRGGTAIVASRPWIVKCMVRSRDDAGMVMLIVTCPAVCVESPFASPWEPRHSMGITRLYMDLDMDFLVLVVSIDIS